MAGRVCPACRKDVDTPPEPEPARQLFDAVQSVRRDQIGTGAAPPEFRQHPTERELNPQTADPAVTEYAEFDPRVRQMAARRKMLYGAAWAFGGIMVTAFSYQAAAGAGGGTYLVAWGAILYGAIQIFRGLAESGEP